jgi:hypothetical protein
VKTLTVSEARPKLGAWLEKALRGEDIGLVWEGKIVALRPVEVYSEDYALRDYGVSGKQAGRALRAAKGEIKQARRKGKMKQYSGNLRAALRED